MGEAAKAFCVEEPEDLSGQGIDPKLVSKKTEPAIFFCHRQVAQPEQVKNL